MRIRFNWKDFQDYAEITPSVNHDEKKLEFGYYDFNTDDVYDKEGDLDYISPRFIKLFQQFKLIFHEYWPNKYILLPEFHDVKKKNKLLTILRKKPFNPSDYKSLDEFI